MKTSRKNIKEVILELREDQYLIADRLVVLAIETLNGDLSNKREQASLRIERDRIKIAIEVLGSLR